MAWYFDGNYPWVGMLFCAPIIGLWYWCTDQYIVQRVLGAQNEQVARRGSICSAALKLLPVFIFIIPGMIAFALARSPLQDPAGAGELDPAAIIQVAEGQTIDPNGLSVHDQAKLALRNGLFKEGYQPNPDDLALDRENLNRDNAQAAFPLLVAKILPSGVRGIVVAGLLAALMSSLAGAFNASAALFTIDFYSKIKPDAPQKQVVWVGRVATVVMVVIGLAWIPVIKGGKGLYDYLQGIPSYLAPPIFVVFFLGVFNKRLNAKGCLWALIVGFALGLFRLAVDTPVKLGLGGLSDGYTEGSFFWIINNMYFQYYSLVIFLVCIAVMIVVSHMTSPPSYDKIKGLTYGTLTDEDRKATRASWNKWDVIASVGVLVAILAAYLYFRG